MQSASMDDIHIGQNDAWKVPGGRWPAIVLAIVLLDVVCFYALADLRWTPHILFG